MPFDASVLLLPDPVALTAAFRSSVPTRRRLSWTGHDAATAALDRDPLGRWASYLGAYVAACSIPAGAAAGVTAAL